MTQIEIIYGGRPALTIGMAAQRHGMTLETMRKAIHRLSRLGRLEALPEPIDGRTPLYDAQRLAEALEGRPGKGKAYES